MDGLYLYDGREDVCFCLLIITSFIPFKPVILMLPSDSQELPSEGNDNEFLPNHSNSYESMIKEHQERRSLMLNDQLVLPSGLSSLHRDHFQQEEEEAPMEGMLGGGSGLKSRGQSAGSLQQGEENQFLMNQNSLVASIKEALHSNQSQFHSKNSQQPYSQQAIPSRQPSFPMQSNLQSNQNSHSQQASSHSLQNSNRPIHHSRNSHMMENNIESKMQHSSGNHNQLEAEMSRNSEESDPFQNANHQESEHQQDQNFPPSSALENHQNGLESNEFNQHQRQSNEQHHLIFNQSFSNQPKEDSKFSQKQKSISQIQGLHSDLDPMSEPQAQESNPNIHSNPSQEIPSHEQQGSKENSLSNLMKYNYFQKAYHQFSQKVESQEMAPSQDVMQSDVKLFNQQEREQEGNMSQQSHEAEVKGEEGSRSPSEIDHILMTYESKSNIKSNSHSQQPSIINNIHDISQNSNNSQRNQPQSEQISQNQQSLRHSNQERINLQQLDLIAKQHKQQINELDMSRSRQSSNHQSSHPSQEGYFNQFNEQQHFQQEQQRYEAELNNQSQHEKTESQNYEENPNPFQDNSIRSEKSSKMRLQSNISMPSIQPPKRQSYSKLDQYQLHSSKNHKKQHSVIQRSSKNASDLHLPEIETKKRPSEISKRSNITKKSPSINVDNQSKISLGHSKPNIYSKKSSLRLDKNIREKMVSYSEGVHVQSGEQRSQAYRDTLIGETTLDSKSIIMKKKETSARQIFNTVPQDINIITSQHTSPYSNQPARVRAAPINQKTPKDNEVSLRSPNKERQQQLERIRVLKQAQRKRLERQLQKVKKELQQINTREKDMDRVFDQKQKIEVKERQRLVNSRENDFTTKVTRHHRQNEALLNIIKQHRKSKEIGEQGGQNYQENITKNLLQLNQIRKQAQQKQREKKRLQILDRMKKNEVRKMNEQKLVKANNHYIQQFRSVDNPVLSPQPNTHHQSKEKGLASHKKMQKEAPHPNKGPQFMLPDRRRVGGNAYQQKLD